MSNEQAVNDQHNVTLIVQGGEYEIYLPNPQTNDIQSYIAQKHSPYELDMLQDMQARLSADELVLDIGANVGNHTLYLAAIAGCRVVAFEPDQILAHTLNTNLALNKLDQKVQILTTGADTDSIPLNNLDRGHWPGTVSAIRVDVEGLPSDILQGSQQLIRRDQPAVYVKCLTEEQFAHTHQWLNRQGYIYWDTFNNTPTHLFLPVSGIDSLQLQAHSLYQTAREPYRTKGQEEELRQLLEVTAQLDKKVSDVSNQLRILRQRPAYPGQRFFYKLISLSKKAVIFIRTFFSKNKKLSRSLMQYQFSNTGVRLESYLADISNTLSKNDAIAALEAFRRDDPEQGFHVICEKSLVNPRLRKRAKSHLIRAEAVVRCSRRGMDLPEKAVSPVYTPHADSIFYLMHMRAPVIRNGYTERTRLILETLQHIGYKPTGITRLGFPWDISRFKNTPLEREEVLDGVLMTALLDNEEGLLTRPVDGLINGYADKVVEQAQIKRPSVIHAASNYMNGLAAVIAARKLGVHSLYEVRGLWHLTQLSRDENYQYTEKYALEHRMELLAVNEADRVVVISEGLRQYFIDLGVEKEKLFVVPNGVNSETLHPLERDEELAQQLSISPETVVIGYVGSIVDYEGLDVLLDATDILCQRGISGFKLVIVGGGKAANTLIEQAERLNLGDVCQFTGPVPKDEVQAYYSLIDIAPFPRKESPVTKLVPPLKPMEAMAMESVVMVSKLPALVEIGQDGESVLQFNSDDASALADALQKVIQSKALRDKLGKAGREWVKKERSVDALGNRMRSAYQSLDSV